MSQFSGHDHTIFINEYQRNYDVIMSKQQQIRINYIEEASIISDGKKIKYYLIWKTFSKLQCSGHEHTILLNEYQGNYDVIMTRQ